MNGTPIQQMSQQVVTLAFIVCRLWRPIPGGATAREQPASNPRNGPFRPTSAESGGKAYPGCAATQGEVLRAQRRVSDEGATLIWVGVGGECPAWQRSALASCGDAVLEKSEALGILDHGVQSGSAAAANRSRRGLKSRRPRKKMLYLSRPPRRPRSCMRLPNWTGKPPRRRCDGPLNRY